MKTFTLQYKNMLASHIRTCQLFRATIIMIVLLVPCSHNLYAQPKTKSDFDSYTTYKEYKHKKSDRVISRTEYLNKMYGFWLGQCIANWTGLVTEMDKIGSIGELKTGAFYTREDWGKPDLPSIWGQGVPSNLSPTIDFVFVKPDSIWGSDDDTDIEYIYQELLYQNKQIMLSGEQIRDGWLAHIKKEEENYLWVSNQKAFDLMKEWFLPQQENLKIILNLK